MYEPLSDLGIFSQFPSILVVSLLCGSLVVLLHSRLGKTAGVLGTLHRSLSQKQGAIILASLILVYVLIFASLSIQRHDALHSHAYDLGIFDQVIWNTANGRFFENTVMLEYSASLLGNHLSPVLLLFVPLYWLAPEVRLLLILQTVFLALGAVPVYLYARRFFASPPLPLFTAASYLVFPALHYVNLFDFHEIALAVPFLGFAFYYLTERRDRLFVLFFLLALLCREEVAFIGMTLGLYILIGQKRIGFGLAVIAFASIWGYLAIVYLIPHFQGESDYYYVVRYGYLGKSVNEIAGTILTQPLFVLEHLTVRPKVDFVLRLLVPLGILSTAGGEILALSLPTFAYLLLSDYREQHTIFFQYSAPLIPFVFLAAVLGIKRLASLSGGKRNLVTLFLATYLAATGVFSYQQFGPGPLSSRFDGSRYAPSAHADLGRRLISEIPVAASLSAQSDLVPQASQRKEIYTFPNLHGAEYVLLDLQSIPWPLSTEDYQTAVFEMRRNVLYQLTFARDGYMLFQRSSNPNFGEDLGQNLGRGIAIRAINPLSRSIEAGQDLEVALYWQANLGKSPPIRERLSTFVVFVDEAGTIATSDEKEPGWGLVRTDKWLAGETVRVEYRLNLPNNLAVANYRIVAGVRPVEDAKKEDLTHSIAAGRASIAELGPLPLAPSAIR